MERKRLILEESDVSQRVVGETKQGKELKVGRYNSGMHYIYFADGGQIPRMLSGKYLRYEEAADAIQLYLDMMSRVKPKKKTKKSKE